MRQFRWILTAAALTSTCAWAAEPATPPAVQTPARSASGIDLAGIDHSVRPGNDFDNFANGAWKKTAEIPADRSSTGVFLQVFLKAEQRTADLIKAAAASNAPAGSNERKIADYYAAYMDEATIEKRGLTPIESALKEIGAINSKADLARVLGEGLRADVDPVNATNFQTERLFGLFVSHGLQEAGRNIPYLLQGGLGMPTRDYYLSSDKAMVDTRGKYLAYVAALLKQAGIADADAKAKSILELETKIAKAHVDIVDTQDIHKANNPWPLASFDKSAPGLDWNAYFKAAGLDQQKIVNVWQVPGIKGLSALTASEPLQTWKDYLTFHALNESASLLPKAYADLRFGFFGQTLQGTPKERDRWKRAVASTNVALGDAVGQIYVKKYFPASSKTQVEQMVKNILAAFDERVDHLEWMTPATRQKAKAKIANIKVSVGYPETWREYAKLEIRPDDALGNQQRAEKYEYEHQLAKLGQPVDRGEWWMTPQTVNAVNLPLQNALNFPAAILEAPFFDPKVDPAANYGSIGAIIGHEISHSFDNLGAEFDANGNLANWWTPEDQAHFKAAGQRLVEQFNAYEALPGLHVNGQQTLGENIADVSGLTIAYLAYQKSLGGKPAPVIDGLTGDQRFFLAFGQSWREKVREAALRARVLGNEHAPGRFRAQTVRNIDAWYDAFQPKPGETLYLAPEDRVRIW
ncbi:M13 family peptidase [Dyella solisilvae]|uniref:M13 family peptidase n=1 Tax=Dyella solisilvae TaxID=1920168 RepID=A0A370K4Q8_9GAMM|nr:M13 family metallopeptidase [Dyella solisilvae]RDI97632.1 M13 family peptidase [Dyella solisilvae]